MDNFYNLIIKDFIQADLYQEVDEYSVALHNGHVIVVFEGEQCCGIVVNSDIQSGKYTIFKDILAPKPRVDIDDNVYQVLALMCQHNYEYLTVFDSNVFIGLISKNAILTHVIHLHAKPNTVVEAMHELEAELELKNKFFSVIGHDINNLFNQVLGSLELLERRIVKYNENDIISLIRVIRKSAEHVHSAFDALILWSRLSTGKSPFRPEHISLNEEFNKVRDKFNLAVYTKKISINNRLSKDMMVYADANMLSCILLNLVYNAIKFTEAEGEIWLDALATTHSTKILVSDNGKGMNIMQKQRLFSYTESTPGTANEMGTGLGLIICKDFVDKHNGVIEFESEESRGTKVIITLPNKPDAT